MIRTAEHTLTPQESQRILQYIADKINYAKTSNDIVLQRKLEDIQDAYNKTQYTQAIHQIRTLGENTQQLLDISNLRDQMISGYFQETHLHLFVRTVAALDWLFAQDAASRIKQWPTLQDKALYFISLVNELKAINDKIPEVSIVESVINDLKNRLEEIQANVSLDIVLQINKALVELGELYKCRISDKKIKCQNI
jgi:hypothetical protein